MTTPKAKLKGWVDYDRHLLPALSLPERVDYFELRARLILIEPLGQILKDQIHRSNSSALLIFGVSLCCAIEATGKFLSGGRVGNGKRFEDFVKSHMNPDFYKLQLNQVFYGDVLWKSFRNGLAHGFAVSHGGFEVNQGNYFAVKNYAGYDVLMIDPYLFYQDFCQGFDAYLRDLRTAAPGDALLQDFDHVFSDVLILGN